MPAVWVIGTTVSKSYAFVKKQAIHLKRSNFLKNNFLIGLLMTRFYGFLFASDP